MGMLAGKVALVTGGSRGIGEGIVRAFVREGATVCFTYRNRAESAQALVSELGGERCLALPCDSGDFDSVAAVIDDLRGRHGGIDILVNNAGITRDGPLALMGVEQFQEVVQTNLMGTFHFSKASIKTMISRRGGVIVNIASIAGMVGSEAQTNYSASKGGVIAFTRSLAKEVGRYGIRAVALAPGFTDTEMYAKIPIPIRKKQLEAVALRRPGTVAEIAETVVFLASDRASYITGTTIRVDGGME